MNAPSGGTSNNATSSRGNGPGTLAQARQPVRVGEPRWANGLGGARCAVALSFDSDHETSDLRDGGKSIGRLAWGQYGNRVGVPRTS